MKKIVVKKFKKTLKALKRKGLYNPKLDIQIDPMNKIGTIDTTEYDGDDIYNEFTVHSTEIQKVVKKIWEPEMVPYVILALYGFSTLCSRFRWFNFAAATLADNSEDKHELYKIILDNSDCGEDILLYDYYNIRETANYIRIIADLDSEAIKKCFYNIVVPLCRAFFSGEKDLYLEYSDDDIKVTKKDWESIYRNIGKFYGYQVPRDIIKFLIENFLVYVDHADTGLYDPYFLFPAEYYDEFSSYIKENVKGWSEVY